MTVFRMEHVGVVVDDLNAAIGFFAALGLEPQGEMIVEGDSVDRVVNLEGASSRVAFLDTQDGDCKLELTEFQSPSYEGESPPLPSHAPGIRHILFSVDDIEAALAGLQAQGGELVGELVNYEDIYMLCYVRGPSGIIVELAEKIG